MLLGRDPRFRKTLLALRMKLGYSGNMKARPLTPRKAADFLREADRQAAEQEVEELRAREYYNRVYGQRG